MQNTCSIANNGAITLTISGGTPAYTYLWSNGATSENLSNKGAGAYVVTVIDANGCSASSSYSITVTTSITVTASSNSPITAGATLDLTASSTVTGATYAWSGPNSFSSTSQNPTLSSAPTAASGAYKVTATTSCSSASATTNVIVNAATTTCAAPSPTATFINNLGKKASYKISWAAVSGAKKYAVEYKTGSGAYANASTTGTSITLSFTKGDSATIGVATVCSSSQSAYTIITISTAAKLSGSKSCKLKVKF